MECYNSDCKKHHKSYGSFCSLLGDNGQRYCKYHKDKPGPTLREYFNKQASLTNVHDWKYNVLNQIITAIEDLQNERKT